MFQHNDRDNFLKHASLVAVIAHMIADTIVKAAGGSAVACIFQLMSRQGNAGDFRILSAGSHSHAKAAPSASDIEDIVAGLQIQLCCKTRQLVYLRRVQRFVRIMKIGTAILPPRIKERVEQRV